MRSQDYKIKIEADNSGAVRVIDDTGQKLKGMSKDSTQAVNELGGAFDAASLKVGAFITGAVAGFLTFRTAIAAINRGADLDEMSKAFESISGDADKARVNLDKFVAAADGLISRADLMKSGSRALLQGFSADQFAELTGIATKLSDIAGAGDLETLNALTEAMATGREIGLKRIGVLMDLAKVEKEYAESIDVKTLNEAQKAAVFRVEAMEALRQKASELTDTETNLRDEMDRLTVSFADSWDAFSILMAELVKASGVVPFLTRVFQDLKLVMDSFNGDTLVGVAAQLDLVQTKIKDVETSLQRGVNVGTMASTGERWSKMLGGTGDFNADKLTAEQSKLIAQLAELKKKYEELSGAGESATKTYEQQREELKALLATLKDESQARTGSTKASKDQEKALRDQEKALKDLQRAQEQEARTVMRVVERSTEYKDILDKLNKGQIDNAEAADQLNDLYSEKINIIRRLQTAEEELAEYIKKIGENSEVSTDQVADLVQEVAKLNQELGGADGKKEIKLNLSGDINSIFGALSSSGFSDLLSKMTGGKLDLGKLGSAVNSAYGADGFNLAAIYTMGIMAVVAGFEQLSAFQKDWDSIKGLTEKQMIEQGTHSAAFAAGDTVGMGGVTEEMSKLAADNWWAKGLDPIGSFVRDTNKWFGWFGVNMGAVARDQIDKYFEDLLDEKRISLVIDGKLYEIDKIMEEKLNQPWVEGREGAAYDPFPGLEENAQSIFTNVGMAFESMFDVMGEISGQWGNVLANNVGGSLNNLQLLLQGLGISQEQLAEQLEIMWLNGEMSSQAFLTAGAQLQNLYEQGIPGAFGATDQAFQNLIDSGGAGRQVMDALGDAAAEAFEALGDNATLDDLRENLIASGADAEKVQQLFDALAKVGITSLEQLKDVGVNASAQIGAELEKTGDFFSDINAELDDMEERYNKLKDKEVNLTFNVKTNIDKNTAENKDLLSKTGFNTSDFNNGATQ
jgi:hypothetical protein